LTVSRGRGEKGTESRTTKRFLNGREKERRGVHRSHGDGKGMEGLHVFVKFRGRKKKEGEDRNLISLTLFLGGKGGEKRKEVNVNRRRKERSVDQT